MNKQVVEPHLPVAGPWLTDGEVKPRDAADLPDTAVAVTNRDGSQTIALVHADAGDGPLTAHLIAAAPELLSALEFMIEAFETRGPEGGHPAIRTARRAISKAQGRTRNKSRGVSYKRACAIALKLPGVEESTSYGTPSLKVKGKILARLRSEAEGALALRCDFQDRSSLLKADSSAFFMTDHYLNYPMILIRLDKVRQADLTRLIHRAWQIVAPPKLLAEYLGRSKARG